MKYIVLDEYSVLKYNKQGTNSLMIRIGDVKETKGTLLTGGYLDILELEFYDIDRSEFEGVFNSSILEKIYDFIKKHRSDNIDEIIVHCSAGISRSAAVMIAVSKFIGAPDMERAIVDSKKFYPNKLVLDVVSSNPKEVISGYDLNDNEFLNIKFWEECECDVDLIEEEEGIYKIVLN